MQLTQGLAHGWQQQLGGAGRYAAEAPQLVSFPQPFSASSSFATAQTPWFFDYGHLTFWFLFFGTFVIVVWLAYVSWALVRGLEQRRVVRETRGFSRAQTGDTLTAVLPLTWSVTMLAHAGTHSTNFDENTSATIFSFTVIAYQWGWNYYFPQEVAELLTGAPRLVGRGSLSEGQPGDAYGRLLARARRDYLTQLHGLHRLGARHGRFTPASGLATLLPSLGNRTPLPTWSVTGLPLVASSVGAGAGVVTLGHSTPLELTTEAYLIAATRLGAVSRGGLTLLARACTHPVVPGGQSHPRTQSYGLGGFFADRGVGLATLTAGFQTPVVGVGVGNRLGGVHAHLALYLPPHLPSLAGVAQFVTRALRADTCGGWWASRPGAALRVAPVNLTNCTPMAPRPSTQAVPGYPWGGVGLAGLPGSPARFDYLGGSDPAQPGGACAVVREYQVATRGVVLGLVGGEDTSMGASDGRANSPAAAQELLGLGGRGLAPALPFGLATVVARPTRPGTRVGAALGLATGGAGRATWGVPIGTAGQVSQAWGWAGAVAPVGEVIPQRPLKPISAVPAIQLPGYLDPHAAIGYIRGVPLRTYLTLRVGARPNPFLFALVSGEDHCWLVCSAGGHPKLLWGYPPRHPNTHPFSFLDVYPHVDTSLTSTQRITVWYCDEGERSNPPHFEWRRTLANLPPLKRAILHGSSLATDGVLFRRIPGWGEQALPRGPWALNSLWLEGPAEVQPVRMAGASTGDVLQANARTQSVELGALGGFLTGWRTLWAWQVAAASFPRDRNFRVQFLRRPQTGLGNGGFEGPRGMAHSAEFLALQRQRFDKNAQVTLLPRIGQTGVVPGGWELGRAVLDTEWGSVLPLLAQSLPQPHVDLDPMFLNPRWAGELNTSRRSDHDARFRVTWGPLAAVVASGQGRWGGVMGPQAFGNLAVRTRQQVALFSQEASQLTAFSGENPGPQLIAGSLVDLPVMWVGAGGQVRGARGVIYGGARLVTGIAGRGVGGACAGQRQVGPWAALWAFRSRSVRAGGYLGMVGTSNDPCYWGIRLAAHAEAYHHLAYLLAVRAGVGLSTTPLLPTQPPVVSLALPTVGGGQAQGRLARAGYETLGIEVGSQRRLRVTKGIYLPADTPLHGIFGSKDVIHSWAIPGLGVKIDCIPGYSSHRRLLLRWRGLYWGQCMEVCGRYHHWMPILVRVVHKDAFLVWCLAYLRVLTDRTVGGVQLPTCQVAREVWEVAAALQAR